MAVRHRLAQAFGRLIRSAEDKGAFVLLGASTPSRLLSAFPPDVQVSRVPLADAASAIRDFLRDCAPHTPPLTQADGTESGLTG